MKNFMTSNNGFPEYKNLLKTLEGLEAEDRWGKHLPLRPFDFL